MRHGRVAPTLALAVGAFVAIALTATALAGRSFDSNVSMKFDTSGLADYLAGRVSSEKAGCERNRDVKIKRDPTGSSGYNTVETVRTNSEGRYRYDPPNPIPNGYYKGVAVRKEIDAGTCTVARSKPVFVD